MKIEDGGNRYLPPDPQRRITSVLEKYRPEDALARIPDTEFEQFVFGMKSIYSIIFEQEKPDLIIAPWRGAAPLVWTLEEMAKRRGDTLPECIAIPLGTNVDVANGGHQKGISATSKIHIISTYLETIYETMGENVHKIMLLDEANTGGTISQAAHHFNHILESMRDKYQWNVSFVSVAAHNIKGAGGNIAGGFANFLSNHWMGATHKIAIPMPQMDKKWLLPVILRQDPEVRKDEAVTHPYESWELLEMIPNLKAQTAYQERVGRILEASGWTE